ncbi:hypothetical protein EAI_10834, partial [Harpegnathos saltator]
MLDSRSRDVRLTFNRCSIDVR